MQMRLQLVTRFDENCSRASSTIGAQSISPTPVVEETVVIGESSKDDRLEESGTPTVRRA